MSDQSEGVQVVFGANISGLTDGLRQATAGVQQATAQMAGHFNSLSSTLGAMKGPFLALTGILAGGALFKDAVAATIKWNSEAMKLARTLGTTTEQASILNLALGDIYTDAETYTRAVQMMTRQINSGGEGFKKLGVDVKDANGNLKPSTQLMDEVLAKLNTLKAGTDRNTAGVAIFGRSWGEASKLLKLNAQVMDEARQKAERLHLLVGPEGVEMTKGYKSAMNEVDDVMTSLKVQIGSAILPALVKLGAWFGEIGPGLAMVLGASIKGLVTAFYVLKFAIEVVVAWVTDFFEKTVEGFKTVGAVIAKVAKGDFQGAVDAAKEGNARIEQINRESVNITRDLWTKLGDDLAEVWDGPKKKSGKPDAPEGEHFDPEKGKDKGDERVRQWDATLKAEEAGQARQAALRGQFYERDLAAELAYWQKKLALTDLTEKEKAAVKVRAAAVEVELYKTDLEAKKAALDAEASAERVNLERKLELVKQEAAMYQAGTKGYEQARKKVLDVEREIEAEKKALQLQAANFTRDLQLKEIEGEEAQLNHRKAMGTLSADEEMAALRDLEDRKFQARQEALNAALDQDNLTREQRQALLNEEYLLEEDHQQKLQALRNRAAEEQRSAMASFLQPLTQAFQTGLEGLLAGTMSWANATKSLMRGLGQVVDQMITRTVMAWITGEKTKTGATQMGVLQRVALEAWAVMKSVALAIWAGIKWIAIKGYEAAAGAYSAISSIPFVGPFLAPAVAAGVLASVIGMAGKISSAAGGWETVPHDQMAMIHKDEQVLPASYASGLRQLIKSGGAGAGQPPQEIHQHTWNVQTMDASSFEDFLMTKGQAAVVKVSREAARNGRMG